VSVLGERVSRWHRDWVRSEADPKGGETSRSMLLGAYQVPWQVANLQERARSYVGRSQGDIASSFALRSSGVGDERAGLDMQAFLLGGDLLAFIGIGQPAQ
jgi:hypothetical protein